MPPVKLVLPLSLLTAAAVAMVTAGGGPHGGAAGAGAPIGGSGAHAAPPGDGVPPVRVQSSPPGETNGARRLPIVRRHLSGRRVVARLPVDRLLSAPGARHGRLGIAAELQLTICLAPTQLGRERECPGRSYSYDPKVRAALRLRGNRPGGGPAFQRLTPRRTIRCRQGKPDSNHHCVIDLGWRSKPVSRLHPARFCARGCRLELVASAAHPRAQRGHRVVVGSTRGDRVGGNDKTQIHAALRPAKGGGARTLIDRRPARRRMPISIAGRPTARKVVFSVRVNRPRAGERLVVEGRYRGSIRHLPYSVRTRAGIVLTKKPRSRNPHSKLTRRVAAGSPVLSGETNFNCTKGPSAHRSPCPLSEAATVRIVRNAKRPVFVNLVVGHGAIGPRSERRTKAHRVRVGEGKLLVRRYPPSG